jgi:ABC-2 type transport system permease protein
MESGWRSGLPNLWHKESYFWGANRRWPRMAALWTTLLNGLYLIFLLPAIGVGPAAISSRGAVQAQVGGQALDATPLYICIVFFIAALSLFVNIGTVVQLQDAVIAERQHGTLAWILSKPASRTAFIFSKCAPLSKMLFTMVLLPGMVALLQIRFVAGVMLPVSTELVLLGWLAGSMTFFFALTLLLSTLLNSRPPVLGAGLVAAFAVGQLGRPVSDLLAASSWQVPVLAVVGFVCLAAVCVLIAVWRFQQEEF